MTRTVEELVHYGFNAPIDALVGITLAEAALFMANVDWEDWGGRPFGPWPARLCGRVCLILDLPPNHYVNRDGQAVPL